MTVQQSSNGNIRNTTGKDQYLQFDTNPPHIPTDVGTFSWDNTNACAQVQVSTDSILSLGEEEYYPLVLNNTGSDIPNGTVVSYSTVNGGIEIVKFIADGTIDPNRILGITTQLIANGASGRVTKFGYIHSLYTIGWNAGDVIYASPSTAGGMTNTKPTAPNLVIPIGIVRTVDAAVGVLLARVLPQQRLYYGVMSDSSTQNIWGANAPQAVTFNTTDIASGFSRGATTSQIIAANSGLYNFQFSLQLRSSNSSAVSVFIWPRINGTDVANSASEWIIKSNSEVYVPSWNFVLSLAANQYFELIWAASGTSVSLASTAAITSPYARPAIPSVILTVTQANQ